MTTITLENIKSEHTKLGTMIAKIEADMKEHSFSEYTGKRIPLALGERYVGTIISADGSRQHHIILLPGEANDVTWNAAGAWATSIGGELPDRVESALLFATMKDEFKPEWYWTREPHASNSSVAWTQNFYSGDQDGDGKSYEGRARAVRRLSI